MKDIINRINKGFYYQCYLELNYEHVLEYDKITRLKMVDVIRQIALEEPQKMLRYLEVEHIERLQTFARNTVKDPNWMLEDDFLKPELFFAMDLKQENQYTMRPEFVKFFSIYDYKKDLDTQQYHCFKTLVKGMLWVHGIVFIDHLEQVFNNHRPQKFKHYPDVVFSDYEQLIHYLLSRYVSIYRDAIIHEFFEDNEIEPISIPTYKGYSIDDYLTMGSTEFSKTYLDSLHEEERTRLENLSYGTAEHMTNLIQMRDLDDIFKDSVHSRGPLYYQEGRYPGIINHWPLWILGGKTLDIYDKEMFNSTLSETLQDAFQKIIHEFIHYANKVYRYKSHHHDLITFSQSTSDQEISEILEDAFKRPKFMDRFIASRKEKPEHFDEIIQGFQNAIIVTRGYADKFENGKLLVYYEDKIYHVLGITRPIQNVISEEYLPHFIDTILIPLNDSITYALSIRQYQIHIGDNIRNIFKNDMRTAKHVYSIRDL